MKYYRLLATVTSVSFLLTAPSSITAQGEGDFVIHSAEYPMEALEDLTDGDLTALAGLLQRPIAHMIDSAVQYGGELETIVMTVKGGWARGDMDPVNQIYYVLDPTGMFTMVNGAREIYADIDEQALSSMMPGGQPQRPGGVNPMEMMRQAMGERGEPPKIEHGKTRAADCDGEAVEATYGGPIGDMDDWTPGQERIHAIACLWDNPALHKTLTSLMDRMEKFSSMEEEQADDIEDQIEKEWMKTKVQRWAKWLFAGGMYTPDVSARFERTEFRKRQVDRGEFTEHRDKQYRKVSIMELFQSMGN